MLETYRLSPAPVRRFRAIQREDPAPKRCAREGWHFFAIRTFIRYTRGAVIHW